MELHEANIHYFRDTQPHPPTFAYFASNYIHYQHTIDPVSQAPKPGLLTAYDNPVARAHFRDIDKEEYLDRFRRELNDIRGRSVNNLIDRAILFKSKKGPLLEVKKAVNTFNLFLPLFPEFEFDTPLHGLSVHKTSRGSLSPYAQVEASISSACERLYGRRQNRKSKEESVKQIILALRQYNHQVSALSLQSPTVPFRRSPNWTKPANKFPPFKKQCTKGYLSQQSTRPSASQTTIREKSKEIVPISDPRTQKMSVPRPGLITQNLPSVREDGTQQTTSPTRDAAKLNMLRRMRPPPFKYCWTFYHDRHSDTADYTGRLTVLLENIISLKPFWEAFNRFPLENLRMKDSVHFFKRGVRPVWEDPRNVRGGSWTFRVPKDKSAQFWKETLLLAVGEQFADVLEPRDDICGLSLSTRFNSNLITVWNRDGGNQKAIDGILEVVLAQISEAIKPRENTYYYKKHSEHAGFQEAVTKAQESQAARVQAEEAGLIAEAKVTVTDVEKQDEELLKEAEAGEIGPA
ncbi:MAG: hypothetical protein MMC23_007795 [Stictis urceolatum]|nr:hypothetical protein [Stictis urceolata]